MSKREKVNSLAVDFQPDAVEIAMRPLPFAARLGVWIGIIFFFGALAASWFCQVDVIVNGTGKLVSAEQNIVMKPLDRTVIRSIDVRVGQVVRKGDCLIKFDPTINKKEEERLKSDMQSIDAQFDRWNAEYSEKEYNPVDPNKDEQIQRMIWIQRNQFFQQKLRSFDESVKGIEARIQGYTRTLAAKEEELKTRLEYYKMYEELNRSEAASQATLLQIRMEIADLKSEVEEVRSSIPAAQHERESALASRETFVMEWKKDVAEQHVAAKKSRISIQTSLDKVLQLTQYVELYAPCDAIVHEIASFPVGSAVREAEALITLVPINCEIELEAEIPAKDIGRVKVGDDVRVKLNAFPFQKHGTLSGKIRTISEDTFQKQQKQNELDSATYYRARIPLQGSLKNVHDSFRLIPGMEAQVEIKVGTRRVIEYIVYPLIKSLDEAIREP